MRKITEICKMPHIHIEDVFVDKDKNPEAIIGIIGWVSFRDKKFTGSFIAGFNEGGMEHVSVSSLKKRQLPDWETMCRIKEIFWEDEEMVVQIHPKKSEYLHGVGLPGNELENVLHLWRPADGDWSRLEGKNGKNHSI